MIRRQTWIFLAIFGLVLAFTVYLNHKPSNPGDETPIPTEIPRLFPDWAVESIRSIEIVTGAENFRLQQNQDASWRLANSEQPLRQGRVQELLAYLSTLRILSSLVSAPPPEATGLANPEIQISIIKEDSTTVVRIGSLTSTRSGYYIQIDDQLPVIVSRAAIESMLEITTLEEMIEITSIPDVTASPSTP